MLKEYEINSSTLAIIPIDENSSKVMEEESEYVVNKSATSIIEDSCIYFGSTLKGRSEGTRHLIGGTYKVPIVIEESRDIIFFPTSSPKMEECCWISLNNLISYEKLDKQSVIKFKNGFILSTDMSYFSLENQILRASRLENVMRRRKNS